MLSLRYSLLILFLIFQNTDSFGQHELGILKLKVIQDNSQKIWNDFNLSNKDTIIHSYLNFYRKKTIVDSIPQGEYKLKLFSEFNDSIETQVKIDKRTTFKMNTKGYYQWDNLKTNFIDRLTNTDTLKYYINESGCFHWLSAYCRITRNDSIYFIHFRTPEGKFKYQLKQSDVEALRQIETIGRNYKFNAGSTTRSSYWLCLNKKLVNFEINGSNYISKLFVSYHTLDE